MSVHGVSSSTRGLDSSTALEYVRALRIATDILKHTTIVSIYQAGEKLYEVFDKVCLIYEGRMIYFGPADQARQYFVDMGYAPVNRQTTADFLVAVTDPLGRKQRNDYNPSVHGSLPQTPAEFESYYGKSDLRKRNLEDLDAYKRDFIKQEKSHTYLESAVAEHGRFSRKKVSSASLYFDRNTDEFVEPLYYLPTYANKDCHASESADHTRKMVYGSIANIVCCPELIMRVLVYLFPECLLFRPSSLAPCSRISRRQPLRISHAVAFYSCKESFAICGIGLTAISAVFVPALFSMSEIPALFAQRPIVHRHQRAAMYHPMAEAIAMTIVDLPITFITMALYTIIVYFIVHLQRTAGQYL